MGRKEKKDDYDAIPLVACKYCKSLHIREDDNGNDLCMRCSSINEIENYETIDKYLEKVKDGK